jgi:hypothetical protein
MLSSNILEKEMQNHLIIEEVLGIGHFWASTLLTSAQKRDFSAMGLPWERIETAVDSTNRATLLVSESANW